MERAARTHDVATSSLVRQLQQRMEARARLDDLSHLRLKPYTRQAGKVGARGEVEGEYLLVWGVLPRTCAAAQCNPISGWPPENERRPTRPPARVARPLSTSSKRCPRVFDRLRRVASLLCTTGQRPPTANSPDRAVLVPPAKPGKASMVRPGRPMHMIRLGKYCTVYSVLRTEYFVDACHCTAPRISSPVDESPCAVESHARRINTKYPGTTAGG